MPPVPLSCIGWRDGELVITYATVADVAEYAVMLAKPSVTEHVFFGPNTPEQTEAFFVPMVEPMAAAVARGERPYPHVFTVRNREGALVGECALVPEMFSDGNFEIGYQLDEPFWGRGFGTRMAELMVWYAFTELGAHRLSANTLASNAGSVRILEKLGFRREGLRPAFYTKGGVHRDKVLLGVRRKDLTADLAAIGQRIEPIAR